MSQANKDSARRQRPWAFLLALTLLVAVCAAAIAQGDTAPIQAETVVEPMQYYSDGLTFWESLSGALPADTAEMHTVDYFLRDPLGSTWMHYYTEEREHGRLTRGPLYNPIEPTGDYSQVFLGWYGDEGLTAGPVNLLRTPVTADLSLYASFGDEAEVYEPEALEVVITLMPSLGLAEAAGATDAAEAADAAEDGEPAAEADPDTAPDTALEPLAEANPDTALEPTTEADPDTALEPLAEANPDTDPDTALDTDLEPATEVGPDTALEPATEADPDTALDTTLEPAAEASPDTDPDTALEPATEANPDIAPDTDLEPATEASPEPVPAELIAAMQSEDEALPQGLMCTINARIEGVPEGVRYDLQWQNDLSGTLTDIPGETGASITFPASRESLSCEWRLRISF